MSKAQFLLPANAKVKLILTSHGRFCSESFAGVEHSSSCKLFHCEFVSSTFLTHSDSHLKEVWTRLYGGFESVCQKGANFVELLKNRNYCLTIFCSVQMSRTPVTDHGILIGNLNLVSKIVWCLAPKQKWKLSYGPVFHHHTLDCESDIRADLKLSCVYALGSTGVHPLVWSGRI